MSEHHPAIQPIIAAYLKMADHAHYRPQAPSDGLGNITVPLEHLDLNKEAAEFVADWMREENSIDHAIGFPSFEGRPAFIYTIYAARALAGTMYDVAEKLLELALEEVKTIKAERAQK